MQPTFDFETAMAIALGSPSFPDSPLAWIMIDGAQLLAAREETGPGWRAGASRSPRWN